MFSSNSIKDGTHSHRCSLLPTNVTSGKAKSPGHPASPCNDVLTTTLVSAVSSSSGYPSLASPRSHDDHSLLSSSLPALVSAGRPTYTGNTPEFFASAKPSTPLPDHYFLSASNPTATIRNTPSDGSRTTATNRQPRAQPTKEPDSSDRQHSQARWSAAYCWKKLKLSPRNRWAGSGNAGDQRHSPRVRKRSARTTVLPDVNLPGGCKERFNWARLRYKRPRQGKGSHIDEHEQPSVPVYSHPECLDTQTSTQVTLEPYPSIDVWREKGAKLDLDKRPQSESMKHDATDIDCGASYQLAKTLSKSSHQLQTLYSSGVCTGSSRSSVSKLADQLSKISRKKKRRIWIIAAVTIVVAVLGLLILVIILRLCIPKTIQKEMNAASLELHSAYLTNPTLSGFDLLVNTSVLRRVKLPIQLEDFEATVFYPLVDDTVPLLAGRRERLTKSALFSTQPHNRNTRNLPNPLLTQHPYVTTARFLAGTDAIPTNPKTVKFSTEPASAEQIFKKLGYMQIPRAKLQGYTSNIVYNTSFVITDPELFKNFLFNFVQNGHAKWQLHGAPIAHFLGFQWNNIIFDKTLHLKGLSFSPTPTLTKEKESESITEEDETDDFPVLESHNATYEEPEKNDYMLPLKPLLRVAGIDFSGSEPDRTNIRLVVHYQNAEGSLTVSPLGHVVVVALFEDQPIVELMSTNPKTTFEPGLNILTFTGSILPSPSADDASDAEEERGVAVSNLLSACLRGDAPILEIQGVRSSIPLYSAAIQGIRQMVPANFFNENTMSRDEEDQRGQQNLALQATSLAELSEPTKNNERGKKESPSVLRGLTVETLDIIETGLSPLQFDIRGRVRVELANPFGARTTLAVPHGVMQGAIAFNWRPNGDLSPLSIGIIRGSFWGSKRSRQVYLPTYCLDNKNSPECAEAILKALSPTPPRQSNATQSNVNEIDTAEWKNQKNGLYVGVQEDTETVPFMDVLGKLPSAVQYLDMAGTMRLDASTTEQYVATLVQRFITAQTIHITLSNTQANLTVSCSLGAVQLTDVPIKGNFAILGLGSGDSSPLPSAEPQMQNRNDINIILPKEPTNPSISLKSFRVQKAPVAPFTRGRLGSGFIVHAHIQLPETIRVNFYLGTLVLELKYQGQHLLYLAAPDCALRAHDPQNILHFKGPFRFLDASLTGLFSFAGASLLNGNRFVEAQFTSWDSVKRVLSLDSDEAAQDYFFLDNYQPSWAANALANVTLRIPIDTQLAQGAARVPDLSLEHDLEQENPLAFSGMPVPLSANEKRSDAVNSISHQSQRRRSRDATVPPTPTRRPLTFGNGLGMQLLKDLFGGRSLQVDNTRQGQTTN